MSLVGKSTIQQPMSLTDLDNLAYDPDTLTVVRRSPDLFATDLAITDAAGSQATVTSLVTLLDGLEANDYVFLANFTNSENNGQWQVTGTITENSVILTKQDLIDPIDELAGNNIQWNHERNFVWTVSSPPPEIVNNGVGDFTLFIPTNSAGVWSLEFIANRTSPPVDDRGQFSIPTLVNIVESQ